MDSFKSKKIILLSGARGAGKTTLLIHLLQQSLSYEDIKEKAHVLLIWSLESVLEILKSEKIADLLPDGYIYFADWAGQKNYLKNINQILEKVLKETPNSKYIITIDAADLNDLYDYKERTEIDIIIFSQEIEKYKVLFETRANLYNIQLNEEHYKTFAKRLGQIQNYLIPFFVVKNLEECVKEPEHLATIDTWELPDKEILQEVAKIYLGTEQCLLYEELTQFNAFLNSASFVRYPVFSPQLIKRFMEKKYPINIDLRIKMEEKFQQLIERVKLFEPKQYTIPRIHSVYYYTNTITNMIIRNLNEKIKNNLLKCPDQDQSDMFSNQWINETIESYFTGEKEREDTLLDILIYISFQLNQSEKFHPEITNLIEKLSRLSLKEFSFEEWIQLIIIFSQLLQKPEKITNIELISKIQAQFSNDNITTRIDNGYQIFEINHYYSYFLIGIGNIYYIHTKIEKAIQAYQDAIRVNPNLAETYTNLGNVYADLKQYPKAIQTFQDAIRVNPNLAVAYYILGSVYRVLKHFPNAIQAFQDAIRINPTYANANYNLGITYRDLKQYPKAIQAFQDAVRMSPTDVLAYNNLGVVYNILSDFDNAFISYFNALKINYQNTLVWINILLLLNGKNQNIFFKTKVINNILSLADILFNDQIFLLELLETLIVFESFELYYNIILKLSEKNLFSIYDARINDQFEKHFNKQDFTQINEWIWLIWALLAKLSHEENNYNFYVKQASKSKNESIHNYLKHLLSNF